MNSLQKKITKRVLIIHLIIIFMMVVIPLIRSCFNIKPKEMITMVVMEDFAPSVNIETVANLEKVDSSPSEPTRPDPPPKPDVVPEPVKKPKLQAKPPKKDKPILKPKVEKPKPKVEKPKPKKDAWKPTKTSEMKKGKQVNEKPRISKSDIKKALTGITQKKGATGVPGEFNSYYGKVMSKLYSVWVPPATVTSIARSAEVRFSIRKNGTITARRLSVSSGNSVFDQTVMAAANKISILPKAPSNYKYDYVIVPFAMPE